MSVFGKSTRYLGVTIPDWAAKLRSGAWHKGVKDAQAATRRPATGPDAYRGVPVPSWAKGAAATAWREGVRDAQNT